MKSIKYASLKLANYTSWNMKVNCKEDALARLREFLHSQGIFGKDWVKNTDTYISILSKQNHVRDQILVIEDEDKKEWMESLCNIKIFSFTYNSIADKNSNSSYNIEEFRPEQFLAAEFSTHAINFRSKSNQTIILTTTFVFLAFTWLIKVCNQHLHLPNGNKVQMNRQYYL